MMERAPRCGVPSVVCVQERDVGAKPRKKVRCLAETIVLSLLENMGRTGHVSSIIHPSECFLNLPITKAEERVTSKQTLWV